MNPWLDKQRNRGIRYFWESDINNSTGGQSILSEAVLHSYKAYMVLNLTQVNQSNKPESSHHTSVKENVTLNFDLNKTTDDEIEQRRL